MRARQPCGSLVSAKYHTLGQLLSALNAGTMKEYEGEAAPALLVTLSCAGGDGGRGVRRPGEGLMENANRFGLEGALHEKQEEAKKIRRLQVMISMVTSVIGLDALGDLTERVRSDDEIKVVVTPT